MVQKRRLHEVRRDYISRYTSEDLKVRLFYIFYSRTLAHVDQEDPFNNYDFVDSGKPTLRHEFRASFTSSLVEISLLLGLTKMHHYTHFTVYFILGRFSHLFIQAFAPKFARGICGTPWWKTVKARDEFDRGPSNKRFSCALTPRRIPIQNRQSR